MLLSEQEKYIMEQRMKEKEDKIKQLEARLAKLTQYADWFEND